MSAFVHLRMHSAYSLLRGAVKLPQAISLAEKSGMPALAITDHDNLFGSLEFSQMACKAGIQPIIGYCASVAPFSDAGAARNASQVDCDALVLYAKNDIGYRNLLILASKAYTAPHEGKTPQLSYEDIITHNEGLLVLSAGVEGALCKLLFSQRFNEAEQFLEKMRHVFGNRFYIELSRHGHPVEVATERNLIDLAHKHNMPLVATNHIYFPDESYFQAHDALRCVALGRYTSEENRPKLNAHYRFKSADEMCALFEDVPEAIQNTLHFAKRCHVFSPSRAPILPGFKITDENGDILSESDALRIKAREGLEWRLKEYVFTDAMDDAAKEALRKQYHERLEYELDVIITMKFPGYFLIVSDFIVWAKKHNIPVGPGRGSGAGSVVAWVLSITNLDPIAYGLIFERFLNPERVSMPDFDIDFCQDRRDEVIEYVQQKYGADHVAQIITFGKLQARAVLRDVGRVLQMPYSQVDRICKLVPNNPAAPVTLQEAITLEPLLKEAIDQDETVARLVMLSLKLEGLYRHASTHAAGVVIADRPLQELVPLYQDAKSTMLVVQYSMKYSEEAGLVKFDFLGLKTLSVIQQAVSMLAARGVAIDIDHIPLNDEATYAMLTRAETLGVFQFESAGMQSALRELKPDRLDDLVALGALYRPGPMENIPMYIARKHGRERVDTLHPMLKEVLEETYGVIIYQEQVQKIAQVLAGYTLGAADLLRRAMGKKIKAEMDAQRAIFVKGAEANGVNAQQASNIFDLVAKFAGYGFNKSHAAAYAVVAYQTAYLKANYPVEFIAASMNYEINATDKLSQFVAEAARYGISILPPDINKSNVYFNVEEQADGTLAIRYGLCAVKNVGAQAMELLVEERTQNGAFSSIHDMARRVHAQALNKRQLEHLTMAGAFDSLHANRAQVFDALDSVAGIANSATQERSSAQVSLFAMAEDVIEHHDRFRDIPEWPKMEKLNREFQAIGFYLSAHPMADYEAALASLGVHSSAVIPSRLTSQYGAVKLAGIVQASKIKASARGRFAFVQISDAAGSIEFSIFDEHLLAESHAMLKEGAAIFVEAEGKKDDQGFRIIARRISLLDQKITGTVMRTLHLMIEDHHDIAHIKSVLGAPTANGTRITIDIHTAVGTIKTRLAEHYAVNQKNLMMLQEMPLLHVKAA